MALKKTKKLSHILLLSFNHLLICKKLNVPLTISTLLSTRLLFQANESLFFVTRFNVLHMMTRGRKRSKNEAESRGADSNFVSSFSPFWHFSTSFRILQWPIKFRIFSNDFFIPGLFTISPTFYTQFYDSCHSPKKIETQAVTGEK
jgi:hypothetical protein